MRNLERRYARLIRLYPAAYRAARGPEMLDTLLQAGPSARETRALIVGALRAHAARDHAPSRRLDWLTAFRAAALMLLAGDLVDLGGHLISAFWGPSLAALVLGAVALVTAVRGRYLIASAAALLGIGAAVIWPLYGGGGLGLPLRSPLAVLLLIVLHRYRPARASGALRYLPLLPILLAVGDQLYGAMFPAVSGILQRGALLGVVMAALLWLTIDERVTMAVGLLFLNTLLIQLALITVGGPPHLPAMLLGLAVTALPPLVLLSTAARRRTQWTTP
ncbi:hypothetical protein [Actinoplanes sp. NPDC049265]|uniref:hypothetical protein n=1 Tax=Actinoplanes sp. NPDC049265 TaxID=3363902 RepID=UPI0037234589